MESVGERWEKLLERSFSQALFKNFYINRYIPSVGGGALDAPISVWNTDW
jgi:hypothetical protein